MELLDVVDEFGEPTGEIVERAKAHQEGIWHRTSHVWIFRVRIGRTQVLLQKRSDAKASFPGCYDISSAGHIPAGVGYRESAVRELYEELGIAAEPEELIACGSRQVFWDTEFSGKPFHDREFVRIFALWRDVETCDLRLQEEEVSDAVWMDIDECLAGVRENRFKHCIVADALELAYAGGTFGDGPCSAQCT